MMHYYSLVEVAKKLMHLLLVCQPPLPFLNSWWIKTDWMLTTHLFTLIIIFLLILTFFLICKCIE